MKRVPHFHSSHFGKASDSRCKIVNVVTGQWWIVVCAIRWQPEFDSWITDRSESRENRNHQFNRAPPNSCLCWYISETCFKQVTKVVHVDWFTVDYRHIVTGFETVVIRVDIKPIHPRSPSRIRHPSLLNHAMNRMPECILPTKLLNF